MKSPRWPWGVWRSYEDSTCTEHKTVDGGDIGLMELAKMVHEAKKSEVGKGGGDVKA